MNLLEISIKFTPWSIFEKLRQYYNITKYYKEVLFWKIKKPMNIGNLFLKANFTGIITFSELDWITTQQSGFCRLEESIALKLGRMIDSGTINIGCYISI